MQKAQRHGQNWTRYIWAETESLFVYSDCRYYAGLTRDEALMLGAALAQIRMVSRT